MVEVVPVTAIIRKRRSAARMMAREPAPRLQNRQRGSNREARDADSRTVATLIDRLPAGIGRRYLEASHG